MLGGSLRLGRISNSSLKNKIELSWFQSPNSHINETRTIVLGLVHPKKQQNGFNSSSKIRPNSYPISVLKSGLDQLPTLC